MLINNRSLFSTAITLFLTFFLIPALADPQPKAQSPMIMGYLGNWHVWNKMGETRKDFFQVTGSLQKNTRAVVNNQDLNNQLKHLTAVSYAFLEVYPDVGMHRAVPQTKTNKESLYGTVYWSDPWTDLFNNSSNANFCKDNYIACYFAFEIEKDPHNPRPAVDPSQPYNYFYMGNFDAFTKLPNVKHVISIGGWYHEDGFDKGAFVNPTNFVNSLVKMINKVKAEGGSIDGIDLDYEPAAGYGPDAGQKMVQLVKTLREGLDKNNLQQVMISMAAFADPDKIKQFDAGKGNWRELSKWINYIGIMGYDFHGAWDNPSLTGLQSNLYLDPNDPNPNDFNADRTVKVFMDAGVPASKLILGVPSYGRVVNGVASSANHGLYQTFVADKTPDEDLDRGQVSLYKIVGTWLHKGYEDHLLLDKQGKANGAWAYSPKDQSFVSFDNAAVVGNKVDYVLKNGLGGMMMWELIGDVPTDDLSHASLLKRMSDGLRK